MRLFQNDLVTECGIVVDVKPTVLRQAIPEPVEGLSNRASADLAGRRVYFITARIQHVLRLEYSVCYD
jgi:cbb3-type cytochrome oxidase cytochrome c subunit